MLIVLSSTRTREIAWVPSLSWKKYCVKEVGISHLPPLDPLPFPNAWTNNGLNRFLILGVGFSPWEGESQRKERGKGRVGQSHRATSFALLDARLLQRAPWLGSENCTCLMEPPTVLSSSSWIGASGLMRTCNTPHSPGGIPASRNFGKHHRQYSPLWTSKCLLISWRCCKTCSTQIILIWFNPAFPKCTLFVNNPCYKSLWNALWQAQIQGIHNMEINTTIHLWVTLWVKQMTCHKAGLFQC